MPEASFGLRALDFRQAVLLFCVFLVVCFVLGYPCLGRYDPATTHGLTDSQEYFTMMRFDYDHANPPYKYRILVPSLAGILLPAFTKVHPSTWNPSTLALLVVNSMLLAGAGLLLCMLALRIGCGAAAAIVSPFIFLTCFPVANSFLSGLVDSGEVFCMLLLFHAAAKRRWRLVPFIVVVGALAKETFIVFMVVFLATFWIVSYIAEKKRNAPLAIYSLVSLILGIAALFFVRKLVGEAAYAPHDFSLGRIAAMVSPIYFFECLKDFFFSSGALLYTFAIILPFGLMRIKKLPLWFVAGSGAMGTAAYIAGAYAGISSDLFRPMFTTLGPAFSIASAVFISDMVGTIAKKQGTELS